MREKKDFIVCGRKIVSRHCLLLLLSRVNLLRCFSLHSIELSAHNYIIHSSYIFLRKFQCVLLNGSQVVPDESFCTWLNGKLFARAFDIVQQIQLNYLFAFQSIALNCICVACSCHCTNVQIICYVFPLSRACDAECWRHNLKHIRSIRFVVFNTQFSGLFQLHYITIDLTLKCFYPVFWYRLLQSTLHELITL